SHGVNILEYQKNGLDWIIITTLPRSQFLSSIMKGFWSSLTLFLLALGGSLAFSLKSFKAFLKPIDHLVETTERFSEGDFTQRVKIFHEDEIGQLSHSLNQMADRIQQTLKGSEE